MSPQVQLFNDLLPLFVAVAIPVFSVLRASERRVVALCQGGIVGLIAYFVVRAMLTAVWP